MKAKFILVLVIVAVLGIGYWLFSMPAVDTTVTLSQSEEAIERGGYLVTAGGCYSCHKGSEDSEAMSGGLALETDFGTFYAPNITPDPDTGIGSWNAGDFILALQHGRTPQGSFYFPAFPYRSYAGLSDQEVLDMASYLMAQPPVSNSVPAHQTVAWLQRWMMAAWNLMADITQATPVAESDPVIARGAHLARNLGHCGECHTPRNGLGIPDLSREFSGAELGEDTIEAIDGDALEEWTARNFSLFLLLGLKPDAEFVGGDMGDVIEHNTSRLTDEDRAALAAFFTR